MGHPAIRAMLERQTAWLTCPSDPPRDHRREQWYWSFNDRVITATASYKGSIGDSHQSKGFNPGTNSPFGSDFGSKPDCHNTVDCNGLIWRANYYRCFAP